MNECTFKIKSKIWLKNLNFFQVKNIFPKYMNAIYLTWFQPIWGIPSPSETIVILKTFFKTVLIRCLKNWINNISIIPSISLLITRFWLMFNVTLIWCTKAMSHKMFIIFTIFIFHAIRLNGTSSHRTYVQVFVRWIFCWRVTCIGFWIASDDIFRTHVTIFKTFINIWEKLIKI